MVPQWNKPWFFHNILRRRLAAPASQLLRLGEAQSHLQRWANMATDYQCWMVYTCHLGIFGDVFMNALKCDSQRTWWSIQRLGRLQENERILCWKLLFRFWQNWFVCQFLILIGSFFREATLFFEQKYQKKWHVKKKQTFSCLKNVTKLRRQIAYLRIFLELKAPPKSHHVTLLDLCSVKWQNMTAMACTCTDARCVTFLHPASDCISNTSLYTPP